MTKIEIIERKIKELSRKEIAEFRAWFAEFDGELWDRQFEPDVKAGKLDPLADAASRDHLSGQSTKL